jgi:hypothetical protein
MSIEMPAAKREHFFQPHGARFNRVAIPGRVLGGNEVRRAVAENQLLLDQGGQSGPSSRIRRRQRLGESGEEFERRLVASVQPIDAPDQAARHSHDSALFRGPGLRWLSRPAFDAVGFFGAL